MTKSDNDDEKVEKLVIARKNLPTNLPLGMTLLTYLALERFQASELVWGIFIALWALIWIGSIYNILTEQTVDLFGVLKRAGFK